MSVFERAVYGWCLCILLIPLRESATHFLEARKANLSHRSRELWPQEEVHQPASNCVVWLSVIVCIGHKEPSKVK